MDLDARPELNKERFNCPFCGAYTQQVWGALNMYSTINGNGGTGTVFASDAPPTRVLLDRDPPRWGFPDWPEWFMSECSSCTRRSVWREEKMVFPLASPLQAPHPDLPADAAALYEEARAVEPHSRRAAAALARASLERFLRSRDGADPKARLADLIGDLKGQVTSPLWKLLTAIRYIGNTSLHRDADDNELVALFISGDAADVIVPFFGAINMLVEELITAPNRSEAIYLMIPEGVREIAEREGKK
ncbi:DUF4145 domain-containing protein [Rathayibacter sp. VKM Ac-2801]|uniref:DUF4145 domain-containing protein n=1 Tax=Rathayibacter sp. VKM Ac-2801 TaxID=2609255 RepID=UPI00131F74C6|nr:DUF4145 domain-containing protein [Rathayibacter sp. VKM Ac-2801]QHC71034.1 DUF4145 domain-containing protein [Rathayibacter sp. VKM Ac-2801]